MSAFSFNTTYQPTGDQQKDAIAQIDIMQSRAVQANLAYQSNQDAETLMKQLGQINDELGALLDSLENHTPVIRKKPVRCDDFFLIVVDLLIMIRERKLSEKIFDLFFLSARSEYYATGFPFWPI